MIKEKENGQILEEFIFNASPRELLFIVGEKHLDDRQIQQVKNRLKELKELALETINVARDIEEALKKL